MSNRFQTIYSNFQPKLIISQILVMQSLYYLGLYFWLLFLDFFFGLKFHEGQIYHQNCFQTDNIYGYVNIIAQFLNIPIVILGFTNVIEKGNKVLDFTATIYFIQIIRCLIYNKFSLFPFSWLFINFICAIITIFLGEYICLKFEQNEIQIFNDIVNIVGNKPVNLFKKKDDQLKV